MVRARAVLRLPLKVGGGALVLAVARGPGGGRRYLAGATRRAIAGIGGRGELGGCGSAGGFRGS